MTETGKPKRSDDPPDGIGPHEFRELELMLSGAKPMAMFCDTVPASYETPEAEFAPHLESGALVMREDVYENPVAEFPTRFVYYALPGEEWRIDAVCRINEAIFTGRRNATEQDDRETGRLLGYDEEDIRRYLAWTKIPRGASAPRG